MTRTETQPKVTSSPLERAMKLLEHGGEGGRIAACVFLAGSGHPKYRPLVERIAVNDESDRVRRAARKLLALPADTSAFPAGLASRSPRLRLKAVGQLARSPGKGALPSLVSALRIETSPQVKAAMLETLGRIGGGHQLERLIAYSRSSDPTIRAGALAGLCAVGGRRACQVILTSFLDPDERVRQRAVRALNTMGTEKALELLESMCNAGLPRTRLIAATALGYLYHERATELLKRLLPDPSGHVRKAALRSLRELESLGIGVPTPSTERPGEERPAEETLPAAERPGEERPAEETQPSVDLKVVALDLERPEPRRRMAAVENLGRLGSEEALDVLVEHVTDERNEYIRSRIISLVGRHGGPRPDRYECLVEEYIDSPDTRVAANAIEAARYLGLSRLRPRIRPFLASDSGRLRANALLFLADDPVVDAERELSAMALDENPGIQNSAVYAAGHLAGRRPSIVTQLAPLAQTRNGRVYFHLVETLERLSKQGSAGATRLLHTARGGGLGQTCTLPVLKVAKASFMKRIVAFSLDGLLVFWVFAFLAFALLVALVVLAAILGEDNKFLVGRLLVSNGALLALCYVMVLFIRDGLGKGRGLGKRIVGLRVIDIHTGGGCGFFRSLLRQSTLGFPIINMVEVFLAALDKRGQRLIDKILGTEVIDERGRDVHVLAYIFAIPGFLVISSVMLLLTIHLVGLIAGLFMGG